MIRRSRLPANIRERLPRLAAAFRADSRVAAVYLFGSFARGTEGPLSDVDVAILLTQAIDRSLLGALELDLTAVVSRTLGTDEVSAVILDAAPLPLRYQVIREGRVLLDREPATRIAFEAYTEDMFLDFRPFLDAYDDELLRQLQAAG